MTDGIRIGELAKRCSVDARTIRYYEHIGLLPHPSRAPNGYRQYAQADVQRLGFIKQAKSLGLHLDEIRELLPLADSRDCESLAVALAERADERLAWIDGQIRLLESMREKLTEFRKRQRARQRYTDPDLPCECIQDAPDERRRCDMPDDKATKPVEQDEETSGSECGCGCAEGLPPTQGK